MHNYLTQKICSALNTSQQCMENEYENLQTLYNITNNYKSFNIQLITSDKIDNRKKFAEVPPTHTKRQKYNDTTT